MAEIITDKGAMPEVSREEQEKLESVKKADAAVKSMHDFTSPEVLYNELITSIRKYHPSTDITLIQKAMRQQEKLTRIRSVNPENHISFIPYVSQLSWQIWNLTRRPLLLVCFTMR